MEDIKEFAQWSLGKGPELRPFYFGAYAETEVDEDGKEVHDSEGKVIPLEKPIIEVRGPFLR